MSKADLGMIFVAAARECLSEGTHKIEHCVGQLRDDQVWWRTGEGMNSIANLMLHLSGNMRQWIVSGIGGAPDIRNRPGEFADNSKVPARELLAKLGKTVSEADAVLSRLDNEQLGQPRRIQGFDTNVLAAALDTTAHFRGHTQEIIHLTRAQLGSKYKFDFVPRGKEQESAVSAH